MAEFITSSDVPKLVQNQFQQLATGTGYTVLPNNICLEWGSISVSSGSQQVSVTLPKTLARVYNAVVCVQHPVNEGAYVAYVRTISTNILTLLNTAPQQIHSDGLLWDLSHNYHISRPPYIKVFAD